MSAARVRAYLARIDRLKRVSGSSTEEILREAFKTLLTEWADAEGMVFIAEQPLATGKGRGRKPDGTIRHDIRVVHGYWEAKDDRDDLDAEIAAKRAVGYPTTNIIFEDGREASLWQDGAEALRVDSTDAEALAGLVARFFAWQPPVIEDWRVAVRQFQTDLPAILQELRARIDAAYDGNDDFRAAARTFLDHARDTVNPRIEDADIREMLIQHILTEEIFTSVFRSDFHTENNIARQLYDLERLFLRGAAKSDLLRALEPYYAAIRRAAVEIDSHAEKQTFLKVIYEGFYKTYNPKAADRLGVIYTPNEIVRFMVRGADWLCREHFGKGLIDEGVEILDPCTGTGTFVCELLEFFRGQKELPRKYKEEIHANEVAILPYYVANLNIEATYAEITGQFAEYPNLVFADTLDMTEGLGIRRGQQMSFLGRFSDENIERIRRQDARKISVVIGNPPYNANQQNENDNNKNRTYPNVDRRVKATFVKLSTAQKTKVYDMYSRFYRWAFDRVDDEGVVAFVTNRSFVDSRTFDGFRAYVGDAFGDVVVVDLGGDVRANPRLSGTKNNVFGIQTGVAIAFFVKGGRGEGLRYVRRPEDDTAADKLAWLADRPLETLTPERIEPGARYEWVGQVENDWDDLIPVADKRTKAAKVKGQERAIFKLFSMGVITARDEWMYDHSDEVLSRKVAEFVRRYERGIAKLRYNSDALDVLKSDVTSIKWSRAVSRLAVSKGKNADLSGRAEQSDYRPFSKRWLYHGQKINEMVNQTFRFSGSNRKTPYIGFVSGGRLDFVCLSGTGVPNYAFYSLDPIQCLPRHRYPPTGERIDNITDWALNKFTRRYGKRAGVTKDAIFHYVYACLHDPVWRDTYAINLRREFPRVPFHDDFAAWAAWGERLMALHVGYDGVDPWPIDRRDADADPGRPKLKAHPEAGRIDVDAATTLTGFPPRAWAYRLGNRAGLDWVLDQHKEKKVRDPTVEAWLQDNPDCRYRFADHKERVIDLLACVARVSVETLDIVDALRAASCVGRDG